MIQSIFLTNPEITTPLFQVHRRMARQREYTGIMFSSKKCFGAIDSEMRFFSFKVTQTETNCFLVYAIYLCFQLI